MTVRLSLRSSKQKGTGRIKYEWSQLATDQPQERYSVEIRNRFHVHVLQEEEEEEEDITARYQRFVEANQQAAEACLQQIPKVLRKERCLDPRVTKAREEMNAAYKVTVTERREVGRRQEYKQKKEELHQENSILEQEDLTRKITHIEEAHANQRHGQSWKLINGIPGRKTSQSDKIRGDNAEVCADAWFLHFKILLGNPSEIEGGR